jgi:uncharacterized membrane protein
VDALHELHGPLYASLAAHAAFGGVALLAGAIAISARKGGRPHRRLGLVFVISMAASLSFAIPLIVARRNLFLALLTPFVIYLVSRGMLAAHRAGHRSQRVLAVLALAGSVGLLILGAERLAHGRPISGMPGAFLGLGALGVWISSRDLRSPPALKPPASVLAHATAMIGAYTAAVTAFTAVNFPTDIYAGTAVWLLPAAAGTALAFWWGSRIRRGVASFEVRPESTDSSDPSPERAPEA